MHSRYLLTLISPRGGIHPGGSGVPGLTSWGSDKNGALTNCRFLRASRLFLALGLESRWRVTVGVSMRTNYQSDGNGRDSPS